MSSSRHELLPSETLTQIQDSSLTSSSSQMLAALLLVCSLISSTRCFSSVFLVIQSRRVSSNDLDPHYQKCNCQHSRLHLFTKILFICIKVLLPLILNSFYWNSIYFIFKSIYFLSKSKPSFLFYI